MGLARPMRLVQAEFLAPCGAMPHPVAVQPLKAGKAEKAKAHVEAILIQCLNIPFLPYRVKSDLKPSLEQRE